MNELEIDTRGGHCYRFVTLLVVLLCPSRVQACLAVSHRNGSAALCWAFCWLNPLNLFVTAMLELYI